MVNRRPLGCLKTFRSWHGLQRETKVPFVKSILTWHRFVAVQLWGAGQFSGWPVRRFSMYIHIRNKSAIASASVKKINNIEFSL